MKKQRPFISGASLLVIYPGVSLSQAEVLAYHDCAKEGNVKRV
jgi:hypothetical protein